MNPTVEYLNERNQHTHAMLYRVNGDEQGTRVEIDWNTTDAMDNLFKAMCADFDKALDMADELEWPYEPTYQIEFYM